MKTAREIEIEIEKLEEELQIIRRAEDKSVRELVNASEEVAELRKQTAVLTTRMNNFGGTTEVVISFTLDIGLKYSGLKNGSGFLRPHFKATKIKSNCCRRLDVLLKRDVTLYVSESCMELLWASPEHAKEYLKLEKSAVELWTKVRSYGNDADKIDWEKNGET